MDNNRARLEAGSRGIPCGGSSGTTTSRRPSPQSQLPPMSGPSKRPLYHYHHCLDRRVPLMRNIQPTDPTWWQSGRPAQRRASLRTVETDGRLRLVAQHGERYRMQQVSCTCLGAPNGQAPTQPRFESAAVCPSCTRWSSNVHDFVIKSVCCTRKCSVW